MTVKTALRILMLTRLTRPTPEGEATGDSIFARAVVVDEKRWADWEKVASVDEEKGLYFSQGFLDGRFGDEDVAQDITEAVHAGKNQGEYIGQPGNGLLQWVRADVAPQPSL